MTYLLFQWFGFSYFVMLKLTTYFLVWLSPNQFYSDTSPYRGSILCSVNRILKVDFSRFLLLTRNIINSVTGCIAPRKTNIPETKNKKG